MSKKWDASVMFPTDSNFVNRVIAAEFGPSASSGNPMVTLTCEVVQPEEVEVNGETVTISGVKTTNYYVTTSLDKETKEVDEGKTAANRDKFKSLWSMMGLNPDEINWDNVDTKPMLGKLLLTQMESEMQERRKNPTATQIAAAKAKGVRAEGDIMKHPVTGKSLVQYWPKIREVFGVKESDGVSVAY